MINDFDTTTELCDGGNGTWSDRLIYFDKERWRGNIKIFEGDFCRKGVLNVAWGRHE